MREARPIGLSVQCGLQEVDDRIFDSKLGSLETTRNLTSVSIESLDPRTGHGLNISVLLQNANKLVDGGSRACRRRVHNIQLPRFRECLQKLDRGNCEPLDSRATVIGKIGNDAKVGRNAILEGRDGRADDRVPLTNRLRLHHRPDDVQVECHDLDRTA